MSDGGEDSSTGETALVYLEKIQPKDLVMFSNATKKIIAKNDFQFLGNDYDLNLDTDTDKIRIWGLPFIDPLHPVGVGIMSAIGLGCGFNWLKNRRPFANIRMHGIIAAVATASSWFVYGFFEKQTLQRELVVWDYIKKHPQDFPEVFNPPKKYNEILLPWTPRR